MEAEYIDLGKIGQIVEKNGFKLCYKEKPLQYVIRHPLGSGSNSVIADLILKPAHNLIVLAERSGASSSKLSWPMLRMAILKALQKTGWRVVVVTTDNYVD